jgi:uncharacterized protein YbjQ (UPF0145 family)
MDVSVGRQCYNTVMDGWIQGGRSIQRVLDEMSVLRTRDVAVVANFTEDDTAIKVCSPVFILPDGRSGLGRSRMTPWADRPCGSHHATHDQQRIEPSVKIWSIVMEGWCKRAGKVRGHATRRSLKEMEDAAEAATGNATRSRNAVHPNVLTYTSFIGGLSRSRESELARAAEAVLERMEKFGVFDMVAHTRFSLLGECRESSRTRIGGVWP